MYTPEDFQFADPAQVAAFVAAHSFGLLVSQQAGAPVASHLPFLTEQAEGRLTRLIGHVAKANSQWQDLDGQQVLAVFSGPHAYISAGWYQAENVVPTWNYVAVHITGVARLIDDPAQRMQLLEAFVHRYESDQPQPWAFDSSTPFAERLAEMIVGFAIDITAVEGKAKLSQNHAVERREKVITALRAQGDPNAIAAWMAATLNE